MMSITAVTIRILISRPINPYRFLCLRSIYSFPSSLLAKPYSHKPVTPYLIHRTISTIPVVEVPFNVSHEELSEKLETGPINLIDVREPGEIKSNGHIKGSVAIPLGTLETALRFCDEEFKELYGVDKPRYEDEIIFMCHAGVRSKLAAEIARAAKYKVVREYADGWHGWKARTDLQ